jgi:uncharacterized protein YidB (DUF937 family)
MGFMELIGTLGRQAGAKPGGLTESIGGLLGGGSPIGGLDGLIGKLQQHGLGDVGASWVSKGKNLPISPAQLQAVLGNEHVQAIAARLGIAPDQAAKHLARSLPQVVDRVTPDGKVPDAASLQRALGGLAGRTGGS